jgi:hypothetical protein
VNTIPLLMSVLKDEDRRRTNARLATFQRKNSTSEHDMAAPANRKPLPG